LLRHLERVETGRSADLTKLWVDFYFSENEWFSNSKLHKEFEIDGEVINRSWGDQVQWKEGKNVTVKVVKKKSKKGEKKTKEVREKSFFNFFLDLEVDSDEEDEEGDQQAEDLELQYETAETLYEHVVPKCLEYYLGLIDLD
jgi:nucleosome assembly protein 1-like 1